MQACWAALPAGRTQGASRKRLVGGASSQDAHKGRQGKGSLGAQAHRTHTRGVKEKARWGRKLTGRTQGASLLWTEIGIWAHFTSKSHASCSISWFLDVAGCSCALPHLNQAGWRRTYAKNEQINPISVHRRDAACPRPPRLSSYSRGSLEFPPAMRAPQEYPQSPLW
jgi:hypothetical protein